MTGTERGSVRNTHQGAKNSTRDGVPAKTEESKFLGVRSWTDEACPVLRSDSAAKANVPKKTIMNRKRKNPQAIYKSCSFSESRPAVIRELYLKPRCQEDSLDF